MRETTRVSPSTAAAADDVCACSLFGNRCDIFTQPTTVALTPSDKLNRPQASGTRMVSLAVAAVRLLR